jgi:hypothetical protein
MISNTVSPQSEQEQHMSTFTAGVQYNDLKGSVAADRSDNVAIADHLVGLGVAKLGERVVGYRISFNENPGNEISPSVVFYLQEGSFDDPAAVIRAIDIEMSIQKLFSFFKRFDMVMTVDGETFDDIEVHGPQYD